MADLSVGLVTQADVNTRGRRDDAPYDHINDFVGTPVGSATAGLGPRGDGGFVGIKFNGTDQQYELGLTVRKGLTINTGLLDSDDWTLACRFTSPTSAANQTVYSMGDSAGGGLTLVVLNLSQATDQMEGFVQNAGAQFTQVLGAGQGRILDGREHVMVLVRNGLAVDMWLDGYLAGTATRNIETDFGANNHIWGGFFFDTSRNFFLEGEVFWTAGWDYRLGHADIARLFETPNPFVPVLRPPMFGVGAASVPFTADLSATVDLLQVANLDIQAPIEFIAGVATAAPLVGQSLAVSNLANIGFFTAQMKKSLGQAIDAAALTAFTLDASVMTALVAQDIAFIAPSFVAALGVHATEVLVAQSVDVTKDFLVSLSAPVAAALSAKDLAMTADFLAELAVNATAVLVAGGLDFDNGIAVSAVRENIHRSLTRLIGRHR